MWYGLEFSCISLPPGDETKYGVLEYAWTAAADWFAVIIWVVDKVLTLVRVDDVGGITGGYACVFIAIASLFTKFTSGVCWSCLVLTSVKYSCFGNLFRVINGYFLKEKLIWIERNMNYKCIWYNGTFYINILVFSATFSYISALLWILFWSRKPGYLEKIQYLHSK